MTTSRVSRSNTPFGSPTYPSIPDGIFSALKRRRAHHRVTTMSMGGERAEKICTHRWLQWVQRLVMMEAEAVEEEAVVEENANPP